MNDHYICDRCHRIEAEYLIESTTIRITSDNPFVIAELLLESLAVKMPGPEHHFLVSAALIAALYNHTGQQEKKERGIKAARHRAELVKGGFCGMMGDRGSAVVLGSSLAW